MVKLNKKKFHIKPNADVNNYSMDIQGKTVTMKGSRKKNDIVSLTTLSNTITLNPHAGTPLLGEHPTLTHTFHRKQKK